MAVHEQGGGRFEEHSWKEKSQPITRADSPVASVRFTAKLLYLRCG